MKTTRRLLALIRRITVGNSSLIAWKYEHNGPVDGDKVQLCFPLIRLKSLPMQELNVSNQDFSRRQTSSVTKINICFPLF